MTGTQANLFGRRRLYRSRTHTRLQDSFPLRVSGLFSSQEDPARHGGSFERGYEVELRQSLKVIWKWLWLIVLGSAAVAAIGFWVGASRPPVYRASTSLLVSGGENERAAATYQELLTKRPVIEAAARPLGLDPREVERQIQVELIPGTSIIELTVEHQNPRLAMEIANGMVAAFMDVGRASGGIRARDLVVVEPAIIPIEPAGAPPIIYTFLGTFIGLIFSLGLAFMLEYLNDSFETGADIRQALDLPTLGTIPPLSRRQRHGKPVTLTHPHSPASEAFRTLRTNIRFSGIGQPLSTLLVTSAEPDEGKTTVTAGLGVVLAQSGHQVVLIDADLRNPALHKQFGLSNHTGLTNLLVGDIPNIEECIVETEIDNLRLITSGPAPPDPSDLLGSKKMEEILDKVKTSAEWIVLDAPPTLAVTDAAVIAARVDGVTLVIEARRTSREQARRTCETLRGVGARILGAVLTKAEAEGKGSSHYYYYVAPKQPPQQSTSKESSNPFARSH
jgi:capsular exopolysaccharide synthesis family protein